MNGVNYLEPATTALWQARAALMDQVQKIDRALSALNLSPELPTPDQAKEPLTPTPVQQTTAPFRPIRSSGEWLAREMHNLPDRFTLKFATYASNRVQGAMLDFLRDIDWVPRLTRHRSNLLEGATKTLEVKLGRQPTQDELASEMRVSADEYKKIAEDTAAVGLVSLSRKWFETDSNKDVREVDLLEDTTAQRAWQDHDREEAVRVVTMGLTRTEKAIIVLHYFEDLTMKQVGATIDLTESRISQMHGSIILRLRAKFTEKDLRALLIGDERERVA